MELVTCPWQWNCVHSLICPELTNLLLCKEKVKKKEKKQHLWLSNLCGLIAQRVIWFLVHACLWLTYSLFVSSLHLWIPRCFAVCSKQKALCVWKRETHMFKQLVSCWDRQLTFRGTCVGLTVHCLSVYPS